MRRLRQRPDALTTSHPGAPRHPGRSARWVRLLAGRRSEYDPRGSNAASVVHRGGGGSSRRGRLRRRRADARRAAVAPGRDLLLRLVRDARRRRRVAALGPGREHAPAGRSASTFYPARGPYSSNAASVVRSQMREIAATGIDTVIVSWWGPGLARGRAITPRRRRSRAAAGLDVALHVEPWAGRTPAEVVDGAPRPQRPRHPGRVRLRLVRLPRRGLEAALARASRAGASASSHTRRSREGAARAASRASTRTTCSSTTAARSRRMCQSARQLGLLCAPSVGPGFDAHGRRATPRVRDRERRAVVRPHVAVGAQGDAGRRDDHELQRMARGHADRARTRRSGAVRTYDGAWGLEGVAAERAYLDRTAYWVDRLRGVVVTQAGATRSVSRTARSQ